MTDLSELGRRLVENPPVPPTPPAELRRRWRRRRSRRSAIAGLSLAAVAGCVAAILATTGGTPSRVRVVSPATPPTGTSAVPVQPTALAVGPHGDLYVADPARDQILERLSDGRFVVVAGTGKEGFSGDGGPATKARLNDPSGMAFAPDGTLYFVDLGNHRVRAVYPNGTIKTVAGGGSRGTSGFVTVGTPALRASLTPLDVTFGPKGRLYIATGEQVLRLDGDDTLTPVVGAPSKFGGLHGLGGPATSGSADGANGIAFDSVGNLYITGSATKSLLMVTPSGTLTQPAGGLALYPRGDGGVATNPHGGVVAMGTQNVLSISPHGAKTIISFTSGTFDGIHGFSPNGIAVGRDGTIYLDTNDRDGYAERSAIAAISADGYNTRLLWENTPANPAHPTTLNDRSTSHAIVLSGAGIDSVTFGTREASAIARLERLFGTPETRAPQRQGGSCGIDAVMQWPAMIAYFDHGIFVGYGTRVTSGKKPAEGKETTAKGLRVGDSLSQAEDLYGARLTTSFAQGGAWFVATPAGKLEGYLTSEPNQTPPARIASIEAGSLGCPATSP